MMDFSCNFTKISAPIIKSGRNDEIIKKSSSSTTEPKLSRISKLGPVELPKVVSATMPLFSVGNSSN